MTSRGLTFAASIVFVVNIETAISHEDQRASDHPEDNSNDKTAGILGQFPMHRTADHREAKKHPCYCKIQDCDATGWDARITPASKQRVAIAKPLPPGQRGIADPASKDNYQSAENEANRRGQSCFVSKENHYLSSFISSDAREYPEAAS